VYGIQEHKKSLLGIDMEAYGVAQAAHEMLSERTKFIVCKSVCDFADEDKSDAYQEYCAFVSAEFMKEFLNHHARVLLG
jgi:nucleoside phosphorylase